MTTARLPQLGNIVWAELEGAKGFRKVRPAVVVSATAHIVAGGNLHVLAITTRLPDPLPDDHVLLPWDPQGKARTGLRRKCAAVTSWHAEIAVRDVQQVVGMLPTTVIEELLVKIAAGKPAADVSDKADASATEPPSAP